MNTPSVSEAKENQMEPTTQMPVATGFVGTYNMGAAGRNVQFFYWIQALADALKAEGHAVSVEYINGGLNQFYTLPDSAWLVLDSYRIYACLCHMTTLADPVAWAKTQLSNQKAFGRPPVEPSE
jgi:hypothetical protein